MMTGPALTPTSWHDWFKPFARLGYGARGLVYLLLAFFIGSAALTTGSGGDAKDAVQFITQSTASVILTPLLIVSLAGYCLWRVIQSLFDTDDHGFKPAGLAVRAGLLGAAASYGFLTVYAFSLWWGSAISSGSGSGDGFARTAAAFIGAGPVSIILASVFAIVGSAHIWKAAGRKYRDHIDAPESIMRWIDVAGIGGLTARGLIFVVIAFLLYRRGLAGNGEQASLQAALDFIAGLPFGAWLLGATAGGFLLFSIYSLAEAIWRRINLDDM
ncbi:DUF1206 domain-containing protein [Hoeflea sp. Naph1]|uniref:DUF1206 domain-containing protein n=1 Tax=Hoeflea sp. Naph1 TaxID=3388653 RepID=UPI00398FEBE0